MEIFQQSIIQIEPSDFNPKAHEQIWQLDISLDLQSILQSVKNNKDTSTVYYIYGEPGSGCSTLIQGLCQQLCKTSVVTESEILFFSLNEGFKEEDFWHLMVQCAREQNDSTKKDLLAQSFSDAILEIKKSRLAEFFEEHFKIICIDNTDFCSDFIDSFLSDVLKTCKMTSFLVVNQKDHDRPSDDFVSNVTVNGLCDSAARNLVSTELQQLTLTDDELSNLCGLVNGNPVAIQLVCALLNSQEENINSSILIGDDTSNNHRNARAPWVVEKMLGLISKFLKVSSIGMVCRLSSLRRPLPILSEHAGIQELVKMKLLCVKLDTSSSFPKCIYVHPTIKKHMKSRISSSSEDTGVDVLMLWLSLVSVTLQRLILEAEDNAWAFVPEKWQYVKDVGEKENYNVKELITSVNANVPSLTEYDILKECLYHAYIQSNYKKLAAITFVLDRFLYWHGDTKTTMDVIDYIQKNCPETAISPQLIIRRARFMKNEGNLRGAEATLDKLLQSKTMVGQWKYKEEQDYQVVCGVCVQIKGEIQYRLGHWQQAASLLLRSIQLFGSLPKPDKKGLSSSYGLLSLCLRNMTINDYFPLVQFYGLVQCNPLLAAYFSAQEASKLSVYTPMFFLRHSCQAGEVMLEFAKLTATYHEKQLFLRIAIEDLRDSIQAHQTYKSLTSREQFYILVCACYKVSLALMQLQSNLDQTKGCSLKKLSLQLYEHYCSTSSHVSIDDKAQRLIDHCLTLLGLESFDTEDLPNAGKVLLEYYTRRSAERLTSGTRLACVELFSSPQAMFSSVTPGQLGFSKQDVYHRERDAVEESQMDANEIVDRNAATLDVQEDGNDSVHQTVEVDRCALTLDDPHPQGNRKMPSHKEDDIGIVDQNAITEELQKPSREVSKEEAEITPKGDGDRKDFNKPSGATADKPQGRNAPLRKEASSDEEVDRCAPTEEIQEEKKNAALVKIDKHCATEKDTDSLDRRLLVSQEDEDGNQVEQFGTTGKIQEGIKHVTHSDNRHLVSQNDDSGSQTDPFALKYEIREEINITTENEEEADLARNSKNGDDSKVDGNLATTETAHSRVSKTVDEFALSVGQSEENLNSNVVVQSLEDEIRSLPSHQIPMVGHQDESTATEDERGKRARDAMLWKYDFASNQWRGQPTMVFIGDLLKLDKGKEGKQRDVYTVEFINQDEPLGNSSVLGDVSHFRAC